MHSPNKPNGHRAQVVDLNTRLCPVCHEPFRRNLTGRAKRFCSDACRDSARRDKKAVQRFKNDARYPYGGEPRNDAKSACGPRGNFQKNGGRPPDIHGPRRVIDIEIGGGHIWHEVVSVDGVRSTVTQIRPAALIEKRGKS